MRHRHKTKKLQRNKAQRRALLANQACSLIEEGEMEIHVYKNDYELVDKTILYAGDFMAVKPGEYHLFKANKDTMRKLNKMVILGGNKIDDKLPMLRFLANTVDIIFLAGNTLNQQPHFRIL